MTTDRASGIGQELGVLEGAGLIALMSTEPEIEYLFRHVLIQDAAYESLLKQERRALHARVADVLLALYPAHREDLAPVLAHHYERAEDRPRAIEFLSLAARHARGRFARHEAVDFARRARALLPPDDEIDAEARRLRAELRYLEAEAGSDFIPLSDHETILKAVIVDAETLGDTTLLARAYLQIALARAAIGDQYQRSPELATALERASELADATGTPELIGLALAAVGEARYGASEFVAAIELMERAVAILADSGHPYQASMTAGQLATAYGRVGEFARAVAWADRAFELGETSGDPNATLDADLARSIIESLRGDSVAAIDYANRAASVAERVDNKACAMVAHSVIGEERLKLGEPIEAAAAFQASAELATFCQFMPIKIEQTQLLLQAARAQAGVGHVEFERYERVLELARQMGDRLAEGQLLQQRAQDRIGAGQVNEARPDLAQAAEMFEEIGATPHLEAVRSIQASLSASTRPSGSA